MKDKYLIISIVLVFACLVLLVSLYNLLQEAEKEKPGGEGELRSLIRGEEIETAAEEDFIFTYTNIIVGDAKEIREDRINATRDMMKAGMTHVVVAFGPTIPQNESINEFLDYAKNNGYELALGISAGMCPYNGDYNEVCNSTPELFAVNGDNGKQFLNASCLNYSKCENWNNTWAAIDPNYTGILWENTLKNTEDIVKRANEVYHPDVVLFDTEIWGKPKSIEWHFNEGDPGDNCNCSIIQNGIGATAYYTEWKKRGMELARAVKKVNDSIKVNFYNELPAGTRWIQEYDGSEVNVTGYMPAGAGDFAGPSLYVLPNLEVLEKNINSMNLSGTLPRISPTYMYGYSNFFKYRDMNGSREDNLHFDPSVSREAGRMLREAGTRGFDVYPNAYIAKDWYGDEGHTYWLDHTKALIEGFKEGTDYVGQNKIRNPDFEAFKTKAPSFNWSLPDYVNKNGSALVGLIQFSPVFWSWTDSNPGYKDNATTLTLVEDKKSGVYSWRHTRLGDIGNRTIYSANFSIESGEEGNYIFSIFTKASSTNGKISFYLTNKSIEEKIGETSFQASWNELKEGLHINSGNYTLKIFIEDNTGQKVDIYFDDSSLIVCENTNGGVEICDSIDNDCDGEIDEGLDCGGAPGGPGGPGGPSGPGGQSCIPENKTKTCLNIECGAKNNNCNKTIDCGNCSLGFNCVNGRCINSTSCVAEAKETTCGDLKCGEKKNNCDETIICGECGEDERCENGKCTARATPKPSKIIKSIKEFIGKYKFYFASGVLIVLIGGAFIIIFSKLKRRKKISSIGEKVRIEGKIREAKNLILSAKKRGYSESFIKTLFLNKGWNEKMVERLIKEAK